jgi:hypothetical protein
MFTHPLETMTGIEVANDVFNESMPPTTGYGAAYNIVDKFDDFKLP